MMYVPLHPNANVHHQVKPKPYTLSPEPKARSRTL